MKTFKVGDRVKRILGNNQGFHCGQIGTICDVSECYSIAVRVDGSDHISNWNDVRYLELLETLTPVKTYEPDSTEELINKANEGQAAIRKLRTLPNIDIDLLKRMYGKPLALL